MGESTRMQVINGLRDTKKYREKLAENHKELSLRSVTIEKE